MERIDKVIENAIAKEQLAGANFMLIKDGKELYYTEKGFANIEEKKPYKRDTIFRLYSMSKPITAAAVTILVDRGELEFGQGVDEFLPGFKNVMVWEGDKRVPARRCPNVGDLMSMTSGLPYGGESNLMLGERIWKTYQEIEAGFDTEQKLTTIDVANRFGEAGLEFHPGDAFRYGTSADVLGAIVEVVSGKTFGQFLEDEIFKPLGMKDTAFWVPAEKQDRLASVYEETPEGLKFFFTNNLGINYRMDCPPKFESGGAGLVSTIDDYAAFCNMLINEGEYNGVRILSKAAVRRMGSGRLTPWQLESFWRGWSHLQGYSYGSLMRSCVEPGAGMFAMEDGEYGWDGWLGAYMAVLPKSKTVILLSYQRKDSGTIEVTKKLRNVIDAILSEVE